MNKMLLDRIVLETYHSQGKHGVYNKLAEYYSDELITLKEYEHATSLLNIQLETEDIKLTIKELNIIKMALTSIKEKYRYFGDTLLVQEYTDLIKKIDDVIGG